jgi:alpha-amylase/alpha-mannosidase (GH57 family)
MILPLAKKRDKYTQIVWGIRDFEHRFGRKPEGMWLPETAVDSETLGLMADLGIRYTILSPYQASRSRPLGSRNWREAGGGRIDPSMPYLVRLKSRKSIAVFFYDGPISSGVAFEGLLNRGEYLADRLVGAFSAARTRPQIVHIATDGETYGHHHKQGEMALAYALRYIEKNNLAKLTNYGEFLEKYPPSEEAEIIERSAWSCAHGVGRWSGNCGCSAGTGSGWTQEWRAPLRAALDWLRDGVASLFERNAGLLLKHPWDARNDYISVVLDRSSDNVNWFFKRHAARELTDQEKIAALKLLEMQRHAMLMYTSCGWFFDEVSGIETVQVLQYAGRVLQLAGEISTANLEPRFLDLLERAKSNLPEHRNGRRIYEKLVRPAMVDLPKVGAHYAVSTLFDGYGEVGRTYAYRIDRMDFRLVNQGRARLAFGRVRITSDITWESGDLTFGVIHLGQHSISGGIRRARDNQAYESMVEEITTAFEHGDMYGTIRLLDQNFESGTYSLKLLFRDEQRKIIHQILQDTMLEAESMYRSFYINHGPLMRFVASMGMPLPASLQVAAEVTFTNDLRRLFEREEPDYKKIDALLKETRRAGVKLGETELAIALRKTIDRLAAEFCDNPGELGRLNRLEAAVILARKLPFQVNLWEAQNYYFEVLSTVQSWLNGSPDQPAGGQPPAWIERFRSLGENLGIRI